MKLIDQISELVSDYKAMEKYLNIDHDDLILEFVPMSRVRTDQELRLSTVGNNILTSVQIPRLSTMEDIEKCIDEYGISELKKMKKIINTSEQLKEEQNV